MEFTEWVKSCEHDHMMVPGRITRLRFTAVSLSSTSLFFDFVSFFIPSTPLRVRVTTMTSCNSTANPSNAPESEPEDSGTQLQAHTDPSQPIPTSTKARAKRHIAALEEELETLRQDRGTKQR